MKKTPILSRLWLMLLWLCVLTGCRQQESYVPDTKQSFTSSNNTRPDSYDTVTVADEVTMVFVCKSSGAKKYHLDQNCHGLKRCKHEVVEMKVKDAENIGLGMCGYED